MLPVSYDEQARGDRSAYERYLRGMDASMKQKVALTAAHLLAQGRVADMGMGSGTGSHALAALYPSLDVIGVDINPTMVELARERYRLPNLSFAAGDIAAPCLPDESLDAIFDSSVLHHVTTFTGYDHSAAARALGVQAAMLKRHGMLIVRDFVSPGEGDALLDLPATDGDDSESPASCSSAALFVRFAHEFRKLHAEPGFLFEELACPREGWRRFRLPLRLAAEFVLRKDYRKDWDTEVLEEYTYFTKEQFERVYRQLGLRIVASVPLWNPWIVRHRWDGRFVLRELDESPRELPPTNYLIAGEKVGPGEGVTIEPSEPAPLAGFLTMSHHRNRITGEPRDLVRRPHPTIDVIPWFESEGEVYLIARKSYPRPIVAAADTPALDGSTPVVYLTEPLNVLLRDQPVGRTVVDSLASCAGISASAVRAMREGCVYYPSPGGIEEEVRSVLVEVAPAFAQTDIASGSGFQSSGHVRAIEATQLLRAAQVGGLTDARLEINAYELLQRLGRDPGPWIGDAIEFHSEGSAEPARAADLWERRSRRAFEDSSTPCGFLELRCTRFVERSASAEVVASQALEYVLPATRSINTIAVALLARRNGEILIAVDDDDLPAAQSFNGNSELLVAPAWRIPHAMTRRSEAKEWVAAQLLAEYGFETSQWFDLGGMYHPSPGLTPERVYPFAIEAGPRVSSAARTLHWLPLTDAVANASRLRDGHLRIVLFRAWHATRR
jgi:ubiquinone/menaquinone biosynthesis C-methylase UbiE